MLGAHSRVRLLFPDLGNVLQIVMERALNASSTVEISHTLPDFGNLLQIIRERALNARSTLMSSPTFLDFGNLLHILLERGSPCSWQEAGWPGMCPSSQFSWVPWGKMVSSSAPHACWQSTADSPGASIDC